MTRRKIPRPTDKELAILNVLWRRGPSTVRQVNEEICRDQATGYTTTLKLMQIMTEKGLVVRDESQRTHIYHAKFSQEKTQHQLVHDLLEKAFAGSAEKLVMRALSDKNISIKELQKIKQMLDKLEGRKKS